MFVIAVYDIEQKRVAKILKLFRQYLTWIQNSVFYGSITKAKLVELKQKLKKKIDPNYDSVIFFKLRSEDLLQTEFIGVAEDNLGNII